MQYDQDLEIPAEYLCCAYCRDWNGDELNRRYAKDGQVIGQCLSEDDKSLATLMDIAGLYAFTARDCCCEAFALDAEIRADLNEARNMDRYNGVRRGYDYPLTL